MTNIFEVLEIICLFLNVASLVIISIGWLTCADYYYSISKFMDGLPLFLHTTTSFSISITSIIVGLVSNGIGKEPYFHLAYVTIVLLAIVSTFCYSKIIVLRQYFAYKRGRDL